MTSDGLMRLFLTALALLLGACAQAPLPAQPPVPTLQLALPPPPAKPRYVLERTLYGRADLQGVSQKDTFLSLLAGKPRSEENSGEGLARPQAIAVHQGRVFVVNAMDHAVSVFDLPRRNFYKIGEQGPGTLRAPAGLSIDGRGHLFVADAAANAIFVFDAQGTFLRRIGGPQWFSRLTNVTADPQEERVYAIDNGAATQRVRVFHSLDGRHLFDFGQPGNGPGEFDLPVDLAVGAQGQLAVVDGGNSRVQIFDHQGKYQRSFASAGRQPGQFTRPKEAGADSLGNWYVVDNAQATVEVFSAQGDFLYALGARQPADGPGHYLMPAAIAFDTDGRLFVADQWYGKIEVFRPLR